MEYKLLFDKSNDLGFVPIKDLDQYVQTSSQSNKWVAKALCFLYADLTGKIMNPG